MKKSKTNRNAWSQEEIQLLVNTVNTASKKAKGFMQASAKLGRSAMACSVKYYSIADSVPQKNTKMHSTNSTLSFKIKSWSIKDGELIVQI